MKKKVFSKIFSMLAVAALLSGLVTSCSKKEEDKPVNASVTTTAEAPVTTAAQTTQTTEPAEDENATIMFTDSTGREVEIPKNIERLSPSGPLAQIALYTLAPDKLVGLSNEMSDGEKEYLPESFTKLPVFGGFTQGTLNLEALMTADPQIIIDVGELKENHGKDLDDITAKTGIPAIFIRMELDNLSEAYNTLGELLGATEQSDKIAEYLDKTLADMKGFAGQIAEDEKISVYYAQDDGLTAVVNNSIHDDVIRFVNGDNVAKVESNAKGGSATISMEQLMNWNPEVILFAPGSVYGEIGDMSEWSALTAVSGGKYYEIPAAPYNWLGRPPSINRVIGIQWLGNLLYPDIFDYDIKATAKEFYSLFYHIEITDEQLDTLLSKSTFKD